MVIRLLVIFMLIVLAGGFIFFAGSVIWFGMREFFKLYAPKKRKSAKSAYTPPSPPSP